MHGIESKHRNRPVQESLDAFKEMQQGSEVGLATCLRFKLDMSAGNKALRDPVAFRCNLTHHWRTGHQYKVGEGKCLKPWLPPWLCGGNPAGGVCMTCQMMQSHVGVLGADRSGGEQRINAGQAASFWYWDC
jgi:hypothetical protein